MADPTLSELTERAETAKAITDPNARRVELRAIFGAVTNYRLAAIEEHLGLAHEGLDELLQAASRVATLGSIRLAGSVPGAAGA